MNTLYAGTSGTTISVTCRDEAGNVIDLTSRTATLNCYSFGNSQLAWSHALTADLPTAGTAHYNIVASDFAAAGDYYTTVVITGTGYAYTMVSDSYRIISTQDNGVTIKEFLRFIDISPSNARPDDVIRDYLNQAEAQLLLDVPTLAVSTNPKFIQLRQTLTKIGAAIWYYMNMDEGNINPNARLQKIEYWTEKYNTTSNKLNEILSANSEGNTGIIRRVPNSCYSDENSMYYQGNP